MWKVKYNYISSSSGIRFKIKLIIRFMVKIIWSCDIQDKTQAIRYD